MNVMGQSMLKGNNNMSYKFMGVTVVDPVMGVLEIEEIPTVVEWTKKVPTIRTLTR